MTPFDAAFVAVVGIEGKYSDNPLDSGGPTMYGITEGVARAHGYTGDMKVMPMTIAQKIYRAQYWDLLRLDDVALSSPDVAHELFDSSVNCGVGTAARWLQRSLNVLNQNGAAYPDSMVDGVVGPMTVSNFRHLLAFRGDNGVLVLLRALNCLQGSYYIVLSEDRPKDEAFVYSWLLNRVST